MASLVTDALLFAASEMSGLGPLVAGATSLAVSQMDTTPEPVAPPALSAGRFVGVWIAGSVAAIAWMMAAGMALDDERATRRGGTLK